LQFYKYIKGGNDACHLAYQIRRTSANMAADPAATPQGNTVKSYVERLVKLIPAEMVSVYLAGKSGIQAAFPPGSTAAAQPGSISESVYWVGWTIFCFLLVIGIRAWATSDPVQQVKPEWPAVAIAAASFLIWVYSMGDVFARPDVFGFGHGVWKPLLAMLIVIAWTVVVPQIYRE